MVSDSYYWLYFAPIAIISFMCPPVVGWFGNNLTVKSHAFFFSLLLILFVRCNQSTLKIQDKLHEFHNFLVAFYHPWTRTGKASLFFCISLFTWIAWKSLIVKNSVQLNRRTFCFRNANWCWKKWKLFLWIRYIFLLSLLLKFRKRSLSKGAMLWIGVFGRILMLLIVLKSILSN